jgi:hypothetical protein
MENGINTTKYEAPRIEDHGDLMELTAGGNVGTEFDFTGEVHAGQSTKGHLQPSSP